MGDRAPDAVLTGPDGRAVRLFELLAGPHFTAIAYGPGAAQALARLDWPARGARLRRVFVGDRPAGDCHGFVDARRSFERGYGVRADALVLVRPDGHLASVTVGDGLAGTGPVIAALTPGGSP